MYDEESASAVNNKRDGKAKADGRLDRHLDSTRKRVWFEDQHAGGKLLPLAKGPCPTCNIERRPVAVPRPWYSPIWGKAVGYACKCEMKKQQWPSDKEYHAYNRSVPNEEIIPDEEEFPIPSIRPGDCNVISFHSYCIRNPDWGEEAWGDDKVMFTPREEPCTAGRTATTKERAELGVSRIGFIAKSEMTSPGVTAKAIWKAIIQRIHLESDPKASDDGHKERMIEEYTIRYLSDDGSKLYEVVVNDDYAPSGVGMEDQKFIVVNDKSVLKEHKVFPHVSLSIRTVPSQLGRPHESKSDKSTVNESEEVGTPAQEPASEFLAEREGEGSDDYFTMHANFVIFHHRTPRQKLYQPGPEWKELFKSRRVTFGFFVDTKRSFHNVDSYSSPAVSLPATKPRAKWTGTTSFKLEDKISVSEVEKRLKEQVEENKRRLKLSAKLRKERRKQKQLVAKHVCHMTTCNKDWLCDSDVPPGEGTHSLLYTRYFVPSTFRIGTGGMETFDLDNGAYDKMREDINVKPSIAPHLWITVGGQQHELGKLEGVNPLQVATSMARTSTPGHYIDKPAVVEAMRQRNRWMTTVQLISTMIDEGLELNADVTVEWPKSIQENRDSLSKAIIELFAEGVSLYRFCQDKDESLERCTANGSWEVLSTDPLTRKLIHQNSNTKCKSEEKPSSVPKHHTDEFYKKVILPGAPDRIPGIDGKNEQQIETDIGKETECSLPASKADSISTQENDEDVIDEDRDQESAPSSGASTPRGNGLVEERPDALLWNIMEPVALYCGSDGMEYPLITDTCPAKEVRFQRARAPIDRKPLRPRQHNRPRIMEILCPPRFSKPAHLWNLQPTIAFDLNNGWDLDNPESEEFLWKCIEEMQPTMIFGSPKCAAFSTLANLNKWDDKYEETLREGLRHLQLCHRIYT